MEFNSFFDSIQTGLKKDIKSRRHKIKISVKEFNELAKKYFKNLNNKADRFTFRVEDRDKKNILFILRCYFSLYVEVKKNSIEVFKNFPEKFLLLKEVNQSNHYFTPKTFPKGAVMYSVKAAYSSANKMNGVSLWNNLNTVEGTKIVPSVQINYEYINPII
jgi:hypothetical protein